MVCILFFTVKGARKNNRIKDYHGGNLSSFVEFPVQQNFVKTKFFAATRGAL